MCFSAILDADYRQNWAEFDAILSSFSIRETFKARLANPSIRIPKGFEALFDNPRTPWEQTVKKAIDQHRAKETTRLKLEVFKQRIRQARAESVVRTTGTEKAKEDLRLCGHRIGAALAGLNALARTEIRPVDHRIFPFWYAPIIIQEHGENVVKLARYHLRPFGRPSIVDRIPDLYNAHRGNLESFWHNEFGTTHALMIASSFYENLELDGQKAMLHFVPKPAEPMLIPCLYGVSNQGQPDELLSFASLIDDSPPEVAAAGHDRCIINLRSESVEKWLTPQGRSKAELQAILEDKQRPYYEHERMAA